MTANDKMKRKYVKPARTATMRRAAMMLAAVVMTLAAQTARAQTEVSTWAELKTELEAGGNVRLTGNPERTGNYDFIAVDKAATLDLNGHIISGGDKTISIIGVSTGGNLTITDLSETKNGKIYGARNTSNIEVSGTGAVTLAAGIIGGPSGIIIANSGSFTMTGGTINTENTTSGIGVCINQSGSFTMTGGTITGNNEGVHFVSVTGTMTVSGNVTITGNTQDVSLLYSNPQFVPFTIGGDLSPSSSIGIYTQQDAVAVSGKTFTSGLSGHGSADNFFLNTSAVYYDDIEIVTIGGELGFAKATTLTVNDAGAKGKWCSYYNDSKNMRAPSGVTAYKAKVNDAGTGVALTELFTNGGVICKGQGVLLKADGNIKLTEAAAFANPDGDYTGNELTGADSDADQGANEGHIYVLSKVGDQFGFFLLQSGVQTKGHRAYLVYSGSSAARGYIGFDGDDGSTAIDAPEVAGDSDDSEIYDLMGRKVVGQPKKGIYVKRGRKFIVK